MSVNYTKDPQGGFIAEVQIKEGVFAQIKTKEKFSAQQEQSIDIIIKDLANTTITSFDDFNKNRDLINQTFKENKEFQEILPGVEIASFSKEPTIISPAVSQPSNTSVAPNNTEANNNPNQPSANSGESQTPDNSTQNPEATSSSPSPEAKANFKIEEAVNKEGKKLYQATNGSLYLYFTLPSDSNLSPENSEKIKILFNDAKPETLEAEFKKLNIDKIADISVLPSPKPEFPKEAKDITPASAEQPQQAETQVPTAPPEHGVSVRWNNNGYEYRFYNPDTKNAVYVTTQKEIPQDKVNSIYSGIQKDIDWSNAQSTDNTNKIVEFLKSQEVSLKGDGGLKLPGNPEYILLKTEEPNYSYKLRESSRASNYSIPTSQGVLSFSYAGTIEQEELQKITNWVNSADDKVREKILKDKNKGLSAWGFKDINYVANSVNSTDLITPEKTQTPKTQTREIQPRKTVPNIAPRM
ncbi:MAG: hypothetical protein ACK53K_02755 [Burkholderiales bacterium]